MSFWYGLGFDDLSRMPFAAIKAYHTELPARQAELQLMLAAVVSLPYMEERDRRNTVEAWERLANGRKERTRVPRGVLALRGIRIVDVPMQEAMNV